LARRLVAPAFGGPDRVAAAVAVAAPAERLVLAVMVKPMSCVPPVPMPLRKNRLVDGRALDVDAPTPAAAVVVVCAPAAGTLLLILVESKQEPVSAHVLVAARGHSSRIQR
jgi:hypothetical protein